MIKSILIVYFNSSELHLIETAKTSPRCAKCFIPPKKKQHVTSSSERANKNCSNSDASVEIQSLIQYQNGLLELRSTNELHLIKLERERERERERESCLPHICF